MGKRVVLGDIADVLGVSKNTVSRALRDCSDISEATKKKVREKAEELGYVPNSLSSFLRNAATNLVGVVTCDLLNPYYSCHIDKLVKSIHAAGLTPLLMLTEQGLLDIDIIKTCLNYQVGAIVSFQELTHEASSFLLQKGYPIISYGTISKYEGIPSAYTDDAKGGALVAEACLEKGYRNPAFVCWESKVETAARRLDGFRKTLRKKGLDPKVYRLGYGDSPKKALVLEGNHDFIFAYCDALGLELEEYLAHNGQHPRIVGFDGINTMSLQTLPIPSIACPHEEMAEYVCNEVQKVIKEPNYKMKTKIFPVHLSEPASC